MPPRTGLVATALALALFVGALLGWIAHGEQTRTTVVARASALTPSGATPLDMRVLRGTNPLQVAVSWEQGTYAPTELGLTIWQRRSSGWNAIYTRTISTRKGSNEENIYDIRLQTVDLTGDGRDDLFVVEDLDGSSGHFVYRVLTTGPGRVRQIESRETTTDETTVLANYGELVSYDGVGKDPKTIPGIHCCPLYWRRTVKRWNGRKLVTVHVSRAKTRPYGYPGVGY